MTDPKQPCEGLKTVRDFIRWGASRFSEAGLFFGHGSDNALDESLHLVFQVLSLPWNLPDDYLDARLSISEREKVGQLIEQRVSERKPLAYLLNQAWFCGEPYYVDERVLVPRSPIAELINNEFLPWLEGTPVHRILDLCTGSGCIGLAAAHAFPKASVDLLDISEDALEVAMINIDRHELWGRVQTLRSDLFDALENTTEKPRYDLILSNPPYVDEDDMSDMPDEFHYEPGLGLAAGCDGLDFSRVILARAADYLSENGLLVVEVGNSQWALKEAYPEVPFIWPEFEAGGHGVLILPAADCREYQKVFRHRIKNSSHA
ncbi:50S ribosomal protein L3 N(5)-glutamine methyltransferase [Candidatus Sororendozoicomonas aggregata]|uniref:50S ribosomal protein L3 N(5)-glutamine methyltransferase n=1 Tax=Candidatus Sororendozoicomonas aggregata TaxID=3073239 RepID=UPI002ED2EBC2